MTDAQKLHAFARQICMDRNSHWSGVYAEIVRGGRDRIGMKYTDEAVRVFPRYNVDQAVLETIELLDPDDLPPPDELRVLLVDAALSGSSVFTRQVPGHDKVMSEERHWLKNAFETVSLAEIADQPPLFYRRVLTAAEVDNVRQGLTDRWGAEFHWFPLGEKTHPSLVAYDLASVDEAALKREIWSFLSGRRISRLYELREYGPCYEMEFEADDFTYNGAEAFWSESEGDWIVYCSHENTITVGGALAKALQDSVGRWAADPM